MALAGRVDRCVERSGSHLCVGLDPVGFATAVEAERHVVTVLEASLEHVCAVKPNVAFFEQHGSSGLAVLERLRGRVPGDRLYILDAKRGDIGSTAEAYARALFDVLGADAVTVNPLLGGEAVAPFLARPERGAFILARTSNPGAQEIFETALADGRHLTERIVELGLQWDPSGAVGFVVGATDPGAVASVRSQAPEAPLLLPGVGAQGGPLEAAVRAAAGGPTRRFLVNVSRGIAAAPEGPKRAAARLRAQIDEALAAASPA